MMNPLSPSPSSSSLSAKGKINIRPFRGGNLFINNNNNASNRKHNSLGYIIIISFGILLSTIVVLVLLINVTVIFTSTGRKAISRHYDTSSFTSNNDNIVEQLQHELQIEKEQNRKLFSSSSTSTSSSLKIQRYIKCQELVLQQFTTRIADPTTPLTNLTEYDYKNSRLHIGNQRRLMNFVQSLVGTTKTSSNTQTTTSTIRQRQQLEEQNRKPVSVIVCGGSISLGHGVHPESLRYSDRLEKWFNEQFPINSTKMNTNQQQQHTNKHRVYNKGSHGADICAMAKRISTMKIPTNTPDLFILEFGVNDYQGQDHEIHIDHKTDIFFEGYQKLLVCGEIVIQHLVTKYPNTAIVFLEFSTTILNRKNAQFLHTGIAQHYQIPIISYSNVMIPYYYNLVQQLDPKLLYTIPIVPTNTTNSETTTTTTTTTTSQIYTYPHGCTECRYHEIDVQFRPMGCKSICTFMDRSGYPCDYHTKIVPFPQRQHCYTSFLAHDAVHPSAVGHAIARDLLINTFQQVAFDTCYYIDTNDTNDNDTNDRNIIQQQQYIPKVPGFLASKETIEQHSNFIIVQDTMNMFGDLDPLIHVNKSNGFNLIGDGMADRKGYIATNNNGNEYVEFDITMNNNSTTKSIVSKLNSPCYVIYIAALKSYENMGKFYVTIIDQQTNIETQGTIIDCIWEPHISIPSDIQINYDDYKISEAVESVEAVESTPVACTGQCRIRITTLPQDNDRAGINKVKIMTLSVRECIPQRNSHSKNKQQQQQQPAEEIAEWLPI